MVTLDLLEEHGIREFAKVGDGDQLTQSRLEKADVTVCMNQRVYDECLRCVLVRIYIYIYGQLPILANKGRILQYRIPKRALIGEKLIRKSSRMIID